jgi:hypothetical protein
LSSYKEGTRSTTVSPLKRRGKENIYVAPLERRGKESTALHRRTDGDQLHLPHMSVATTMAGVRFSPTLTCHPSMSKSPPSAFSCTDDPLIPKLGLREAAQVCQCQLTTPIYIIKLSQQRIIKNKHDFHLHNIYITY